MKTLFTLPLIFIFTLIIISACKKGAPTPSPVLTDRKISITVDNTTPAIGTNITFTLVAGNNGPDASTGISVSSMVPTGYTFVSAVATTGTYTAGTWTGFGLANGASATLTIVVKVNATGIYAFTTTISGAEKDPTGANNNSTITPAPAAVPKVLTITTIAGSTSGYADGTGTAAQFSSPRGIALDGTGNIYVVDYSNSRIRKVTPTGVVTTLAGSTNGFADGQGTAAKFSYPNGIAVDAAGNVYIADSGNARIRKITPAGMVSTFAGPNTNITNSIDTFFQPLGVTVDASGNVFVADSHNNRICKVTPTGTITSLAGAPNDRTGSAGYVDGTGTAARFNIPNGLVVDATGNIYVSDASNNRIRKVTSGGMVTTIAGSTQGYADGIGTAAQFGILGLSAIDTKGNIYIGDNWSNSIRKVTPAGVVSTFVISPKDRRALDGPITTATFGWPYSIAVDATGNVYFSDSDNHLIRKISYQ